MVEEDLSPEGEMDAHEGRPVVVGHDGSAPSCRAVDWAADEAARRRTGLVVLAAAGRASVALRRASAAAGSPDAWPPPPALQALHDLAEGGADRARSRRPGLAVHAEAVARGAAGALVEASSGAGLVVVGSRGHAQADSAEPGSVALAVTAHATCPVVVVAGAPDIAAGLDRPVVVAVDGSTAALAAVRFAADHAARATAPVRVLATWHLTAADAWAVTFWSHTYPYPTPQAMLRSLAHQATEAAVDLVRERQPLVEVSGAAVEGAPGAVVADASHGAGLVVVGARGHGGFAGLRLGSVSRAVVRTVACPVAVVPSPELPVDGTTL